MENISVTCVEELFQKWISNDKIRISFAHYVELHINQGVWVQDLPKYSRLLGGGKRRGFYGKN